MLALGAATIAVGIIVLAQAMGVLQGTRGDMLAPAMLALIGLVLLIKHVRGVA